MVLSRCTKCLDVFRLVQIVRFVQASRQQLFMPAMFGVSKTAIVAFGVGRGGLGGVRARRTNVQMAGHLLIISTITAAQSTSGANVIAHELRWNILGKKLIAQIPSHYRASVTFDKAKKQYTVCK